MENIKPYFEQSYITIDNRLYTQAEPQKFPELKIVLFNESLAEALGLLSATTDEAFYEKIISGRENLGSLPPIAQAYAGHQYGNFTMLGDGRAHLLTEIVYDESRFDLQLKGSGETPYSRRGDGKAAVGPMLREYLISEAMFALGIPTTRSLAVATTGEKVIREKIQQGAILARIASSHIRIGTFQFVQAQNDRKLLKNFADYNVQRHYPHLMNAHTNLYLGLLEAVIERQAHLLAQWQSVGFVHGVMNTDNMSVSGETIDYGPCAFMNAYNPQTVFSSIDKRGRYAYGNQPNIAAWNLARFAESLIPLIDEDPQIATDLANAALGKFLTQFNEAYLNLMTKKLGIMTPKEKDAELIAEYLNMLLETHSDYTQSFIDLTHERYEHMACRSHQQFESWLKKLKKRRGDSESSKEAATQLMKISNPAIIPRNHLVEEVLIAAEEGDLEPFKKMLAYLQKPFDHTEEVLEFGKAPETVDVNFRTYCGT